MSNNNQHNLIGYDYQNMLNMLKRQYKKYELSVCCPATWWCMC